MPLSWVLTALILQRTHAVFVKFTGVSIPRTSPILPRALSEKDRIEFPEDMP